MTIVIGAVFCGGRSSRFGTDKALAEVGGVAMGLRVAGALRDSGADPVVAVGGTAGPALGLPTVDDRHPGEGPLGGLSTILRWANTGLVVAAPCDLPLLTAEHLRPLIEAANHDQAAIARIDGRVQPSLACWPAEWGRAAQRRFDHGERAWRVAMDLGSWVPVDVPPEAVADADTPQELAKIWHDRPR